MWVRVKYEKASHMFPIKVSQSTGIACIRSFLALKVNVPRHRLSLSYCGKQLEDSHVLSDYGVQCNDVIKFRRGCLPVTTTDMSQVAKSSQELEEKNNKSRKKKRCRRVCKVHSKYFEVNELVDGKDFVYNAWFQGKITGIKEQTALSDTDEFAGFEDDGLLYRVKFENYEGGKQAVYLPLSRIRPRPKKHLNFIDVNEGDLIMVNYNLHESSSRNFYYDCRITSKADPKSTNLKRQLIGTIYLRSGEPARENCVITNFDEMFAIENIKPLSERNPKFEDDPAQRLNSLDCSCISNSQRCKVCGCHACGSRGQPDKQAICENCGLSYHVWCLKSYLIKIPEEWHCPNCDADILEEIKTKEIKVRKAAELGFALDCSFSCLAWKKSVSYKNGRELKVNVMAVANSNLSESCKRKKVARSKKVLKKIILKCSSREEVNQEHTALISEKLFDKIDTEVVVNITEDCDKQTVEINKNKTVVDESKNLSQSRSLPKSHEKQKVAVTREESSVLKTHGKVYLPATELSMPMDLFSSIVDSEENVVKSKELECSKIDVNSVLKNLSSSPYVTKATSIKKVKMDKIGVKGFSANSVLSVNGEGYEKRKKVLSKEKHKFKSRTSLNSHGSQKNERNSSSEDVKLSKILSNTLVNHQKNKVEEVEENLKECKLQSKMISRNSSLPEKNDKSVQCADHSKENIFNESNKFGPIPGIEVGSMWLYRSQVSECGVHKPHVAGIYGNENEGAYSIVLSGGYEDDEDGGEEFVYTGSGGKLPSERKQSSDQIFTRTNKALAMNCNVPLNESGAVSINWREGKPVRVVRNYKGQKHSKYCPEKGNRYDGIYKVVKYWAEKGKSGFRVWRYLLRRDDPIPPPWSEAGKQRSYDLGLTLQYPEGFRPMPDHLPHSSSCRTNNVSRSMKRKKYSKPSQKHQSVHMRCSVLCLSSVNDLHKICKSMGLEFAGVSNGSLL